MTISATKEETDDNITYVFSSPEVTTTAILKKVDDALSYTVVIESTTETWQDIRDRLDHEMTNFEV